MNKYIVLSVNDNQDYLWYTPLTCWAWRKFGWEPIVFYHRSTRPTKETADKNHIHSDLAGMEELIKTCPGMNLFRPHFLDSIEGYRSDTITQISRLYACQVVKETCYLMTGDIDMIPLSDYWNPNPFKTTVYGHDLTSFSHFPICYIGMGDSAWADVMRLGHGEDYNKMIKRDLDTLPQSKDPDFYKYWFSDQDLITQRLKENGTGNIDFINRGQYSNGYAKGRVDRGSWTLQHDQLIDCHMHRDLFKAFYPDSNPQHVVKWQQTIDMLNKCFPSEDFSWLVNYTEDYAKLAYGK